MASILERLREEAKREEEEKKERAALQSNKNSTTTTTKGTETTNRSTGGTKNSIMTKLLEQSEKERVDAGKASATPLASRMTGTVNTVKSNRPVSSVSRNATGGATTTKSSYYSMPELYKDKDTLYGDITDVESSFLDKQKQVESAVKTLEELEKRVKADPSNQQLYTLYENAYNNYEKLWNEYTPVRDTYSKAVDTYNSYITDQKGQYDAWKGTIRDASEIDKVLADLDAQAKTIKRDLNVYKAGAGAGHEMIGDVPVANKVAELTAQLDEIEKQRALLVEEKEWSEHFGYADLTEGEDFAEYAAKGAAIENTDATNIQNIVSYFRERNTPYMDKYSYMTEDEVDIYNYLLAKEGAESAAEYLNHLDEYINQRKGKEMGEDIRGIDNGVGRVAATGLYGLVAGVDQFAGGMKQMFSREDLPTSAVQYGSQYIQKDLEDQWLGKNLYNATTTIGNMAPSILASTITGGIAGAAGASAAVAGKIAGGVGSAILGTSAAGNAYGQALEQGYNEGQARTYSSLVGASEAVLQYALGGISKLGGVADDVLLAKVAAFESGLKRAALTGAVKVGSEIAEEELQNFIEPLLASVVFNENYDAPTIEELVETAVVTFLTTGALEGNSIVSAGSNKLKGWDMDEAQAIIEEGLHADVNSQSHKLAQALQSQMERGKTVNDFQIDNLYGQNVENVDSTVDPDAALAEAAAEAVAREMGAEATETAQERISSADVKVPSQSASEAQSTARAANEQVSEASVPYNVLNREKGNVSRALNRANYGKNGMETFTAIVRENDTDPNELLIRFDTPYQAGLTGLPMKNASLINDFQLEAYNAGRRDYIARMTADKEHTPNVIWSEAESGFDHSGVPSDVTEAQKRFADFFLKKMGTKGYWNSKEGAGYNAFYDRESGVAEFARDFGIDDELMQKLGSKSYQEKVEALSSTRDNSFVFYIAHEIATHAGMNLAPTEMRAFANAMYNYLQGQTTDENLARSKQMFYGSRNVSLDTSKAIEEVVADSIIMLYNGDEQAFMAAMERIANGNDVAAKQGVRTYRDKLNEIISKLKAWVRKLTGKENAEARANAEKGIQELEHLRDLFEAAIAKSMENVEAMRAEKKVENTSEQAYNGHEKEGIQLSMKEDGKHDRERAQRDGDPAPKGRADSRGDRAVRKPSAEIFSGGDVSRGHRLLNTDPAFGESPRSTWASVGVITPAVGTAAYEEQQIAMEYGVPSFVISDKVWVANGKKPPAFTYDKQIYFRESVPERNRGMLAVHELTHMMKQEKFKPYMRFVSRVPDMMNMKSKEAHILLEGTAKHRGIDVLGKDGMLDLKKLKALKKDSKEFITLYDELNAKVYGHIGGGKMEGLHEIMNNAFLDFDAYAKELTDLHKQFKASQTGKVEVGDTTRYSLKKVTPVQPTSDKWQRGHTESWFVEQGYPLYRDVSEEQAAANAETGQNTRGGKHGTQITSTKQTYEQLFNTIRAEHPGDWQDMRVLDASSGLGLGTRVGRGMGFNVTDIEPFPSENDYMYDKAADGDKNPNPGKFHPDYTDYSLLQREVEDGETEGFDFIVSNAVLNVIPQDTRDDLVDAMGSLLKPGGQMFINVISKTYDGAVKSKPEIQRNAKGVPTGAVRTAEGDYSTGGNKTGRGHETFVWKSNSVQKVFSYNELVAYLEDALGDGYSVKPYTKLGMTAALVTKDEAVQYSLKDHKVGDESATYEENGKQYSLKSLRHDITEGRMFDDLVTAGVFTDKEAKHLKENLDKLISYMLPNADILDMNESYTKDDRPFGVYKPNSDPLYGISLDFSTLCRKRLMTQYVIEQLQLRENRPMSAEEQIAIRSMLLDYRRQEKALQVACAMCYVEAARLKAPKQMEAFFNNTEDIMRKHFAKKDKAFNDKVGAAQAKFKVEHGYAADAAKKDMSGKDTRALNDMSAKMRKGYVPNAEQQAIIDKAKSLPRSTFLTAANLTALSIDYPEIYSAYTDHIRASTRSKSLEGDVPYYYGDSIGPVSDSFIDSVNAENGMRFDSWSDFQMKHMLDMITAVIDLSVRKSKMHGYTKFPEMVRIFGKTGMMFNLSGVTEGNGFDADGNLVFSDTESIDINEAIKLREQFPETAGLQCIGVSDDHIRALLRSEYIDYVIPYHTSGMNATLRRMAGIHAWKNYTSTQHARKDPNAKKPANAEKWQVEPVWSEFYVAKGKDGYDIMEKAAQRYIDMCHGRGLIPKFDQFIGEDGYWKLLIDRKMVNQETGQIIEQQPVKPIFDFDLIQQEIDNEVSHYDPTLEKRALKYVVDNFDAVHQRIKDLKKGHPKKSMLNMANEILQAYAKGTDSTQRSLKGEQAMRNEINRIRREGAKAGKSDAEIENDIAKVVDPEYGELLKTYGQIKRGERPARSIKVPTRTGKNRNVSQTIRTILEAGATPDSAVPTLQELITKGDFSFERITDQSALAEADETIKRKGFETAMAEWLTDVRKGIVSKANTAMGWSLYNAAANAGDLKTAITILNGMVQHQRSAAQALQATRILKKMAPDAQLFGIQRSVDSLKEELENKYRGKVPDINIDEDLARKLLEAETDEERDAATKEIYKDIGRQMPSTFMDKWNAWRYLAMLGNPRTHVRNVAGNFFFAPVVAAKNLAATGIERLVLRNAADRTKSIALASKEGRALIRAAWNDYANVADEITAGGKYNDAAVNNQYIEDGRAIFGRTEQAKTGVGRAVSATLGKAVEKARKGNTAAMEIEDMWFARTHYAFALAQYCKAHGVSVENLRKGKALGNGRAYAVKEAKKATYRDANAFSEAIGELGRYSGKNPAKKAISLVAEGVLPFRKTPANILVRGIEYSPIGLLKGLTYDLVKVKHGDITAAEAIDNISAGLTGTGLLGLGIWLAAEGLIRGAGGGDEEEKKFEELQGHQSYALELPDGTSVTLDWLAPEVLPLFIGVNLYEMASENKGKSSLADVLDAVSNVTEPLLEMSCLQSLNDMFDSVGYATSGGLDALPSALISAATSYLTQAFPTILGQAERSSQDVRMTTYTEKDSFLTSDAQYFLGKVSAKIPGWDFNQIPYIDAWGRTESTGTVVGNMANNFLNPAYMSQIETSEMEEELQRLYEATGESVFPSRPDKYITVDKEKQYLTGEEYVKYATEQGRLSYDVLSDLTSRPEYADMSDTEKAEAVDLALDYAKAVAKTTVSDYEPNGWVADAIKSGMDEVDYMLYKMALSMYDTPNKNGELGGTPTSVEKANAILSRGNLSNGEITALWDTEKGYEAYAAGVDMRAYVEHVSKGGEVKLDKLIEAQSKNISASTYFTFRDMVKKYDKPNANGNLGTYTNDEVKAAIDATSGLTKVQKHYLWVSMGKNEKTSPYK